MCEVKRCRQGSDITYSAGAEPHEICMEHFTKLSRDQLKNPETYRKS